MKEKLEENIEETKVLGETLYYFTCPKCGKEILSLSKNAIIQNSAQHLSSHLG